ncbi:putative DNA-binding domain-containing protein [Pseudomonas granadensis]|uniref:DNA-binding domain-containing protein n=1 Tax=Pseudomonas granadensis TaxID=1421430 RepID=A0ABX7GPT0_9PSED|nr:putative DNA-binding domain-containing protein [Pseudomonas granadensis]MBN6772650.1 putative DNA-binding domain-containing protein [Pseudomonas granadensis]MBN6806410.1 putative DNA-binding domain-containing protein [Pseudomonas granadensis]MBN6830989.1 putative DNA-binding domain-containing protein [Pseudomonas granadensis]MBN6840729.1 putative DNA-binding domain-containing protein [Pseudomonas granadensis]MBN6867893.1 putative DNA-binding domain-containing protein [Pseudomonas granadensi
MNNLQQQQQALTRYLRDPEQQATPADMNAARVEVYRDLVFNNVSQLLSGTFPVLIRIIGEPRWRLLVRGFLRDWRAQTPKFAEIAGEFIDYLAAQPQVLQQGQWPAFLLELAHYEWVEMVLQQSDASALPLTDPALLLQRPLQVSALAWPLAYVWPVHELDPHNQSDTPPTQPTLLLVRRTEDFSVKFSQLSPLALRLLQRIGEFAALTGREQLQVLAEEAGQAASAAFLANGVALLRQLHEDRVVGIT